MRRVLWVCAGVAALAGLSLAFGPVREAAWAVLFLSDFFAGPSPSPFKLLAGEPELTSGVIALGDSGGIPFDLYRCPAPRPQAGLLLTHGLAHLGNQDPRVREQAVRLARAGFVVVAPDLAQMKNYQLGFGDVDALAATLRHLRTLPEVDSTRIGLVAPSFAAGPALIALSRPQVQRQVRFALIFGGYWDLRRTLRYTLTGAYDAEGFTGIVPLAANRHNRWKFLRGNLDLLAPSSSRGEYAAFLGAKIDDPLLDINPVLANFSQEERQLLVFMDNEDPARFDSLYAGLPTAVHAWVDTLSLHHYADQLRTKLLIAHSRADQKVHFTESLTLSRHLPHAPPPEIHILGLFSHVDLRVSWESLRALWDELLPGLWQLYLLALHLLRQGG
ncbi:MAG: hypothetical protein HYW07_03910 [Candidatus Latescibacteria bacterium]|nr:hypothetical protein [Candidatus Latescibacterota bacterium]